MAVLPPDIARTLIDNLAVALMWTAAGSVMLLRLDRAIALLAVQGVLLTGVAAVMAAATGELHFYAVMVITLVVKAAGVPWVLFAALRALKLTSDQERSEIATVLSPWAALALALMLVLVAYRSVGALGPLDPNVARNALPAALAMLLIGAFSMLVRKKALSQVAGLVAMENGLYLAALAATHGLPLAVELGVALDIMVGALVMGQVARQIHLTVGASDTDLLDRLKG